MAWIWSRKRRVEDLDEEIAAHIRMSEQDCMDRGDSPEQAKYSALREFGNLDMVKETTREIWGWIWVEQFLKDLRYGARQLRRTPGFTALAVITLALGIGSATAIFCLVNATLLKELPYKDANRLVVSASITPRAPYPTHWNATEYKTWKASTRNCESEATFETIGAYLMDSAGVQTPLLLSGAAVSARFFPVLGFPIEGRLPGPEETPSIFISQKLFNSRFGGDRAFIGRALRFQFFGEEHVYTVAGVMPSDFQFPPKADFWLPQASVANPTVIARLSPGASISQVKAEFDAMLVSLKGGTNISFSNPETKSKVVFLREFLTGDIGVSMLVLLGAVGLVLLIVCINVVNLLLLRNRKRRREISIRAALGANRFRLARQTLAESAILALAGGVLGILLAWWIIHLLPMYAPRGVLQEQAIRLDSRVICFAFLLSAFAGMLVALLPALRQPWAALSEAIKRSGGQESTGDRKMFTNLLVSAQIALTLAILCGAGLMIRSFIALRGGYPGSRGSNIIKFEIYPSPQSIADLLKAYQTSDRGGFERYFEIIKQTTKQMQFFDRVKKQIELIPEVKRAALTSRLPGDFRIGDIPLRYSPGQMSFHFLPTNTAAATAVSPGYFEQLGIPLIAGRVFTENDIRPNALNVIVINQMLAKLNYPGENPVGKYFRGFDIEGRQKALIIGVVGDMRNRGFRETPFPEVYFPNPTNLLFRSRMSMTIEPRSSVRLPMESIHAAVARVDPGAPISGMMTMDDYIDSFLERDRFSVFLLSVFAFVTLVIAAIGIYGVMTQSVEQRLREMAVRIALGATPLQVMRFVFARGTAQIAIGLAAGLIGSFYMSRTLRALLVEVKPCDPATFFIVLFLLIAVAFLACYAPANRATKADPISILRSE
jgi:ABC-type antimicrobial peptide transport system permease subunit